VGCGCGLLGGGGFAHLVLLAVVCLAGWSLGHLAGYSGAAVLRIWCS
jgi:hypothetical protein